MVYWVGQVLIAGGKRRGEVEKIGNEGEPGSKKGVGGNMF